MYAVDSAPSLSSLTTRPRAPLDHSVVFTVNATGVFGTFREAMWTCDRSIANEEYPLLNVYRPLIDGVLSPVRHARADFCF